MWKERERGGEERKDGEREREGGRERRKETVSYTVKQTKKKKRRKRKEKKNETKAKENEKKKKRRNRDPVKTYKTQQIRSKTEPHRQHDRCYKGKRAQNIPVSKIHRRFSPLVRAKPYPRQCNMNLGVKKFSLVLEKLVSSDAIIKHAIKVNQESGLNFSIIVPVVCSQCRVSFSVSLSIYHFL